MPQSTATPGYLPLDTLKPITDGVYIVDSLLPGLLGKLVAVRMTVVVLPDGGLLLHSPTRLTEALKAELDALGVIRHIIAPNSYHYLFVGQWLQHRPDAVTWGAPGLRARPPVIKSGIRIDKDLTDAGPLDWGGVFELVFIDGAGGFHEVEFFHKPTKTLILTDIIQNLEASKIPPFMRPLLRMAGVVAPHGRAPVYLRASLYKHRMSVGSAVVKMFAFQPARVVFAHGKWFDTDAVASMRRSLNWLFK
jgi:hypothetical protein